MDQRAAGRALEKAEPESSISPRPSSRLKRKAIMVVAVP
eukprot:CAMPEP_0118863744 /NCGR_PEP_ID=MMETSP1163-20130328/8508_1 /TAXON_ID=124430 /ORGANISM="Phaeomonas parva, Strain CCMP2877" /LENGTH=38 /DNA_ID= /DNA_START= /DNA_END= /DNA_ORIENTATION=